MRYSERLPPARMFRVSELLRLITMVLMLGVVFMLIVRAREPATWRWLAAERPRAAAQQPQPATKDRPRDNFRTAEGDSPISAARESGQSPGSDPPKGPEAAAEKTPESPPAKPVPSGPTDQDADEWDAVEEEFQALTDGTLGIPVIEYPAYRRLVEWTRSQPFALLDQRASDDVRFTQLYQSAQEYRGKLVKINLSVRRILKYDEKTVRLLLGDEAKDVELYEVWGFTAESKMRLWEAVVVGLPEGMPVQDSMEENALLAGYFFKLQGYEEAGAKQPAPILRAPMLIGRMVRSTVEVPSIEGGDWFWFTLILGLFVVLVALRWGFYLMGRMRRTAAPPAGAATTGGGVGVEQWLGQTEAGELDEGNNFDAEPDSTDGETDGEIMGNGHGSDISRLFPDRLDGGHSPGG